VPHGYSGFRQSTFYYCDCRDAIVQDPRDESSIGVTICEGRSDVIG